MSGQKWVLLVAGSKGWENYQHQANVCCLYQIIKKKGIPDEQIVVMMYDDIARSSNNKQQNGKIFSVINQIEPVYPIVPKNYTGKDVTPENFLRALQGKDNKGNPVIQSGSNDQIFVYMSGLGDEDTFKFPEAQLSATDLIDAINDMSDSGKFSKMVIYMDSDYSGSMFKTLADSKNVYAVTSCDTNYKNISSDYDANLKVYLSDQFSSALLRFIYSFDFSSSIATLKGLFDFINKNVSKKACQTGDKKINEFPLSEFLQK